MNKVIATALALTLAALATVGTAHADNLTADERREAEALLLEFAMHRDTQSGDTSTLSGILMFKEPMVQRTAEKLRRDKPKMAEMVRAEGYTCLEPYHVRAKQKGDKLIVEFTCGMTNRYHIDIEHRIVERVE